MSEERKTIMAVGGHVGDAELTCGGVMATYALRGYRIVTVALTGGERGNPAHMTVPEYRKQKEEEESRRREETRKQKEEDRISLHGRRTAGYGRCEDAAVRSDPERETGSAYDPLETQHA